MTWTQFLPIEPCAKARPRVTRRGTFMPKSYMTWRKKFCALVKRPAEPIAGRLSVIVLVCTKSGKMRQDLDNVGAAVLDALQDAGVIANDRDATRLSFVMGLPNIGAGIDIRVEMDQ